jgi:multidrug resistance efflux pump
MNKLEDDVMKHCTKILVVIVILSLMVAGCSSAEQETAATPDNTGAQNFGAVINATGVVVPEQWAALSVRSPGLIAEVLVEEGQTVKMGQPLVRLGNSEAAQAEVARAQENLLIAERAFASSEANAFKGLDEAYETLRKAQNDFDNYDIPHDFSGMTPSEALKAMLEKLNKARADFEPYKNISDRNLQLTEAQKRGDEVVRGTAKIYKKNLDDAWADFNSAIRWAKLEADLQQAKAGLDNALKEFDAVSRDSQDASLARAQYLSAQANLSAAQAVLANMELTAPFDGVVCNLDGRVGEWVVPGMILLQLGDLNTLRVETTDLSEIDAARVHPQDVVLVTFDALPDIKVQGTVLRVANKSSEGSGVNYTTVIVLDTIPAGLRWGMTAFADIEVSQ